MWLPSMQCGCRGGVGLKCALIRPKRAKKGVFQRPFGKLFAISYRTNPLQAREYFHLCLFTFPSSEYRSYSFACLIVVFAADSLLCASEPANFFLKTPSYRSETCRAIGPENTYTQGWESASSISRPKVRWATLARPLLSTGGLLHHWVLSAVALH